MRVIKRCKYVDEIRKPVSEQQCVCVRVCVLKVMLYMCTIIVRYIATSTANLLIVPDVLLHDVYAVRKHTPTLS